MNAKKPSADSVLQRTVDGVPVKVGDRVWFWRAGQIRLRALNKIDLGMWWTLTKRIIYSTESAALKGAIEEERKDLKRSKSNVRRANLSILRLTARLAETTDSAQRPE